MALVAGAALVERLSGSKFTDPVTIESVSGGHSLTFRLPRDLIGEPAVLHYAAGAWKADSGAFDRSPDGAEACHAVDVTDRGTPDTALASASPSPVVIVGVALLLVAVSLGRGLVSRTPS